MLKRFLVVAALAAIFVPATSHAVDHSKQWALGYYDSQAPIGVRYQFSPKAAFDLGLGFDTSKEADLTSTTAGATKTLLQYRLEAGIPLTMVKTDRADFFVRPGVMWQSTPYYLFNTTSATYSSERASDISFGLDLGAEWHVTDNLSLSVGHGIHIERSKGVSTGEDVGSVKPESSTFVGTHGLSITDIGFHWYFTP